MGFLNLFYSITRCIKIIYMPFFSFERFFVYYLLLSCFITSAQPFDQLKAEQVIEAYPNVHGFSIELMDIPIKNNVSNWSANLVFKDSITNAVHLFTPSEIEHTIREHPSYKVKRVIWTYIPDDVEAGSCHINMGCPEAQIYQTIGNAVCRISALIDGFVYYSTGVLVNNTAQDGRPLLLTAEHNGLDYFNNRFATQQEMDQWVFAFRFEHSGCSGLPIPKNAIFFEGSTLLARSFDQGGTTGSDFALLELSDSTFNSQDFTFAGWSRSTTSPKSGVSIHHPKAQLKRISFYDTPPTLDVFDLQTSLIHWNVNWTATQSGHGVTEPGSSGSPLLDEQNRIIGTLSGGFSNCSQRHLDDYYGAFFHQWDMNGTQNNQQLAPWLDPLGLNPQSLVEKTLSTDKLEEIHSFKVYPNPAHPNEAIHLDGDFTRIDVFNSLGQFILSTDNQFFAPKAPGVYLLKIQFYDTYRIRKLTVN